MPPETENADFPSRIRSLRARLGLTQVRLAELLCVSFASVNRWENAQATPSKLAWEQIARAEVLGLDAFARTGLIASTIPASTDQAGVEAAIDFSAEPTIVKVVAEGERLSYGHLFNPAFATEISMIDPLPHQRIAVYEKILTQPRIRLLLADDAGAGKTIMGGLTIRELTARRLVRRVLIVVPAGLIGNWEKELRTLFSLHFKIVTGPDARTGNPFIGPDSNFVIVSMDTLAGERMFSRLQEPAVTPYDLAIFDEAHKLSANREPDFTIRKTDRYRLAEALAGLQGADARWSLEWSCHHLLLLTATPHMGRDFPYYFLWRLLEPEVLSTADAFHAYPPDARNRHFVRRTKEEMVKLDGTPIYPPRFSDTLSYDLTQGDISEQALYDQTTAYLQTFYNRARILNRQAAAMAMSVFQRRLASSTYSLMRSFERRIAKLDALIADIRSGRITPDQLLARQRQLGNAVHDIFDEATADEEEAEEGREENEVAEEKILGGVVAVNLTELEAERLQVQGLLELARKVYDKGDESKFDKLREVLRDPRFKDEKILIFTEHRDTLEFLVRRLEGMGFGGQVAQIHGGMDYLERQAQVEFFRRNNSEGGATYMVCTDAAAEGINLQFCWLMVNFDVPWNPARLEQRMGRIHRYGQKRDRVFISNLVAGKTREGRVLKTLLDKLERIRKELGSDKVFDVVGRLFEGVSLKQYMEQAISDDETATQIANKIEGTLTKEQVAALEERERRLYGEGGDVRPELPRLRRDMEQELYRRLLPGYVRRFVEKAAPLLGLETEGDLDGFFCFRAKQTGSALDALWPVLESYSEYQRQRITVYKPEDKDEAIFLHPGEPLFERIRASVTEKFSREALKGAVFVDPETTQPYMLHMATVSVVRKADAALPAFANEETLEYRLVGFKQHPSGEVESCPVEHLLLLKNGTGVPVGTMNFAATAADSRQRVKEHAIERVVSPMAERRRREVAETLAQREEFVSRGFDYQDAELAAMRARLTEKARSGDPKAKGDVTKIRDRQRQLLSRREEALATLRREAELIVPGEVTFIAHALVVPSTDPDDRLRHDAEVEALAMRVARTYEETAGAEVKDVSKPELARAVGLDDWPGFDLLSVRIRNEERAIEVKGCAGVGHVEVTENEWARACNLRNRYWLYVVFNCGSTQPRLMRVQDPFGKLIVRARGGVIIDEKAIFDAAEAGG